MNWSDVSKNPPARVLRQFAVATLIFGGAIGAHQWISRGHDRMGQAIIAVALGVGLLGLVQPKAIRYLFLAAMVAAFPIGWLVSQCVLAVMFYLILTPLALFFRARGRDVLGRKRPGDCQSFWTEASTPEDMRRYFRQY